MVTKEKVGDLSVVERAKFQRFVDSAKAQQEELGDNKERERWTRDRISYCYPINKG